MSLTVGAFEAKTKFSELRDRVERGEEVTITRRGRVVARLTAAEAEPPGGLDLEHLRDIADRFVEEFGRPFRSADIDALLYDEDGLPK